MFNAPGPLRAFNAQANRLFNARHPERRGAPIARNEPTLAREWMAIRNALANAQPRPAPSPMARGRGGCATEDPFPPSVRTPGRPCASDGRKCWPNEGWRDIVDADMPCSSEAVRTPSAYAAILDYFNVAHPANARYAKTARDTFCNIYVHDVTRAMGASIPHWVRDPAQTAHKPIGWRELNANRTCDWLNASGRSAGWVPIDKALLELVARMRTRQQSLASAIPGLAPVVAAAAARIAALPHPNPQLLSHDAYVAQQFANLGLPVVISWKNPTGAAGHVAMVRPETVVTRGTVHRSGLYVPRSAQAGAQNYRDAPATWIVMEKYRTRQMWVHA